MNSLPRNESPTHQRAALGQVEALEQRHHRGLAAARVADQRQGAALVHAQRQAVQHPVGGPGGVGERHILELHLTADLLKWQMISLGNKRQQSCSYFINSILKYTEKINKIAL